MSESTTVGVRLLPVANLTSDGTTGTALTPRAARRSGHRNWQRYVAEALGTFAIVFAGCGAIISNAHSGGVVTHVGIALTFGLVVAAMIFALGPISAAHFNPAVTLSFALARRFPWKHVPAYIGAQVAGALLGSGLHAVLYGSAAQRAKFGATVPTVPLASAVGFEIVLTFLLMLVIMAVATDKRVPGGIAGVAIGGTVALDALFGGLATGASMNPARSLAPALFARGEALAWLPVYLFAPVVGAALAALCFEALRDSSEHAQGAPADLGFGPGQSSGVKTLDDALSAEPGLSRQI